MADNTNDEEPNITNTSIDLQYKKPVRLSLHLIVKRHLPDEAVKWSQERIITELNKIRRVRLDRENIGQIDSMELLSSEVTNLYLQTNQIKCIENLECLPNLQVLVLCHNQLSYVDGISHLEKLVFLDLSENNISDADPDSFPKSIVILNLKDNPCASQDNLRDNLKGSLPKLKQLNEIDFDDDENDSDEFGDSDEEGNGSGDGNNHGDNEDGMHSYTNRIHDVSLRPNYKQLPTIQSSIPDITTDMLMRSQNRLEETSSQHKRHIQEMTNIKIKSKIRPLPKISKSS